MTHLENNFFSSMCAKITYLMFVKKSYFDKMFGFSPKNSKCQLLHRQIWKRKKVEELTAGFRSPIANSQSVCWGMNAEEASNTPHVWHTLLKWYEVVDNSAPCKSNQIKTKQTKETNNNKTCKVFQNIRDMSCMRYLN